MKRLVRIAKTVVLTPVALALLLKVWLRGEWKLVGEEMRKRGLL